MGKTAMDAKAAVFAETPQASLRPMSETLAAAALEVSELAQMSDRLQALISVALIADATNDDHLREFQAIDLLVQRLHGVSIFMKALAGASPHHWQVDAKEATSGVVLSALADRLSGTVAESEPPPSSEDTSSGSMDFFG